MSKWFILTAIALVSIGWSHAATEAVVDVGVIPRPQSVLIEQRLPTLKIAPAKGAVVADASEAASKAAVFLNAEDLGLPKTHLVLEPSLDAEGYRLVVRNSGARIEAADYAGFFNGSRTLAQLVRQSKGGELAAMTIEDSPTFRWRGAMLDVARHYFKPEFLYQLVDVLSDMKVNILHLHLTDDQGWRMQINAYPQLVQRGAWRNDIGWNLEKESSVHYREDGLYGGFYTQEELSDLVAYAAERNITVIPEVDVPGHSRVAVDTYPELVKCAISGASNVYCPAKESSYEFIENVLREVFAVFPSEYVVIGADEVRLDSWKKCSDCQNLMKEKGFTDERQLQHMFVKRIVDFCHANGRIPVGWDEIIEGSETIPNVAVINRFPDGRKVGKAVTDQGRELIRARTPYSYLDYSQGAGGEPLAIGLGGTWEQSYDLKPIPGNVSPQGAKFVSGVEGTLWTEFIASEGHAGYMIFPRMIALAEVAWTDPRRQDKENFRERLQDYFPYLDEQGVSYRPDEGLLQIVEADGMVHLLPGIRGAEVFYTKDGSYPGRDSIRYTEPFPAEGLMNLRVMVYGPKGNEFPVLNRTVGVGRFTITAPESFGRSEIQRILDDDINTFYQSKDPFKEGDEIQIDFEKAIELSGIRVIASRGVLGGRSQFIAKGRLQVSVDGNSFEDVAAFKNGVATVSNKPMEIRAIKIVADETVTPSVRVREVNLYR